MLSEVLEMHTDADVIVEATNRAQRILEANYEKANIEDYVIQQSELSSDEKSRLKSLLFKYESLFDGSLGKLKWAKASFELKDGEKPHHAKPFSVPKIYETLIQKESNRLVGLGVLEKVQESEWGMPAFPVPKKDSTIRFVFDARVLNAKIKRKPYPMRVENPAKFVCATLF